MIAKIRFWSIIVAAFLISACSTSEPVKSEISAYDTTYTHAITAVKKIGNHKYNSLKFATLNKNKRKLYSLEQTEETTHFVEFRARNAFNYGHVSVVFGALRDGKLPIDQEGVLDPKLVQISGLHPATSDPKQWIKGHYVPVPAETGPSDGDFEEAYVLSRFQVYLTGAQFAELVSIVKRHKVSYSHWYAPNYAANCLGYAGSIAREMGMKAPIIPFLPKYFINNLKSLNT